MTRKMRRTPTPIMPMMVNSSCGKQSFAVYKPIYLLTTWKKQGAISLKLLGGKLAPKLVYIVLRKELLKLKWHPDLRCCFCCNFYLTFTVSLTYSMFLHREMEVNISWSIAHNAAFGLTFTYNIYRFFNLFHILIQRNGCQYFLIHPIVSQPWLTHIGRTEHFCVLMRSWLFTVSTQCLQYTQQYLYYTVIYTKFCKYTLLVMCKSLGQALNPHHLGPPSSNDTKWAKIGSVNGYSCIKLQLPISRGNSYIVRWTDRYLWTIDTHLYFHLFIMTANIV